MYERSWDFAGIPGVIFKSLGNELKFPGKLGEMCRISMKV